MKYHEFDLGVGWVTCKGDRCPFCRAGDVPKTADEIALREMELLFPEEARG